VLKITKGVNLSTKFTVPIFIFKGEHPLADFNASLLFSVLFMHLRVFRASLDADQTLLAAMKSNPSIVKGNNSHKEKR